jgi:hypothetical protein
MAKKTPEACAVVGPSAFRSWIGIGPERVRQFATEGVFHRTAKGQYPLQPNVLAYIEWLKNEQRRANRGEAREEVERERARKLKNENDETERLLMRTEDAIAAVSAIFGIVKADFASAASQIGHAVAEKLGPSAFGVARRAAENAIDQVLAGISERLQKAADDMDEGRDPLGLADDDDTDEGKEVGDQADGPL